MGIYLRVGHVKQLVEWNGKHFFIGDGKLGRDASTLEDRDNILNDCDKLEE